MTGTAYDTSDYTDITNQTYSTTYAKMGFEFCNMDIKKYQAIP